MELSPPPPAVTVPGTSLYEAVGGRIGCRALAVAFYGRVERDPVLRPLFPGKSFTCAIEEFSAFLVQFLGGPGEDAQRRWWLSLRESHQHFPIGARERSAWLALMVLALEDVQIDEPLRGDLIAFFERSSAYLVNQESLDAIATPDTQSAAVAELSHRWEAQTLLDEAVAAMQGGDPDGAVRMARSPALRTCSRSVHAGLLARMIRCGNCGLLDYVCARLNADRALIRESYAGRSLLHEAAGAGSLSMVMSLLSLGADPNARDGGGHTPLYSVANECAVAGATEVVRALVLAGADVGADGGVKRCTALHMAARRGNVEVAEALLNCGANLEARDSLGDTSLRRAVNCNKTELAALLLSRGADVHSVGSKGLTPMLATRTTTMKQLLEAAVAERIS